MFSDPQKTKGDPLERDELLTHSYQLVIVQYTYRDKFTDPQHPFGDPVQREEFTDLEPLFGDPSNHLGSLCWGTEFTDPPATIR